MFLTEEVKAALLKYLTITLEPITHSPPELLATYVIAIINNKDKTNEELRVKCENLLETFLFSSTKPFVSKFFELLDNVESPTFIDDLYTEVGVENKSELKKENKDSLQNANNIQEESRSHSEEEFYQKRESTPEDEPINIIVTKKQRVSEHDSRSTNNSRDREDDNRNRDSRRDTKVSDRRSEDDVRSKKPTKDVRDRYDPTLDPMDVRSQPGRTNPISTLNITNKYNPSTQGDGRIRQCYSFFNRGFCEKGANCQYYHGEHMEMDLSELEQLKRREALSQQSLVFTPLTPVPPVNIPFGISTMPQEQKSHYFQQEKMNTNQFNPYQIIGNNSQSSNNNQPNNAYIPPSVRPSKPNNKDEKDQHKQLNKNKESEIENIFAPPENINEYKFNKPVNTFPLSRVRVDTSLSTVICLLNVPHKDNSISKLDEHFNKFGTIVNIEVLQNEKKAKIKFSSHREANTALKSPEAIFGNRFIKVLWNEQVDSNQVSLVNVEEKKLEEERKAEEEKKKEELRKAEQKKAEERRANLLLERLEAAKQKVAKPDLLAKSTITKKRTDLISAKKKLLDQMIDTLKKPELSLEKKQQMLKEVEALKNTIKDDLTKLAQENAALTPVPTPKPTFLSPVKKLSNSIDTGAEGDQDLNIIADELSNLTKKAEQLGVFNSKTARGRGRGRGGFHAASVAPKRPSHLSIDRRPTAFKLTGMPTGNLDEPLLTAHFSKFGTVQSVKIVGNDAIVKMELRYQAENALLNGMVINQHKARGLWYVPEEVATVVTNEATNNNSIHNFEPEIETGPEDETIEVVPETNMSSLETTDQSQVDKKDEMEVI